MNEKKTPTFQVNLRCPLKAVNAYHIADWTVSDPVLQQVLIRVQQDWSEKCPDKRLEPFYVRRNKLISYDGCILRWNRVVIPALGQKQLLEDPHTAHPRMVKMKNMVASYLWWPGLDTDIKDKVKRCKVCQLRRASSAAALLHP